MDQIIYNSSLILVNDHVTRIKFLITRYYYIYPYLKIMKI